MAKLRRGCSRLGMVLAMLWFVYWTCAYIVTPQISDNSPVLVRPTLSFTSDIVLIDTAILGLWWIVAGLRPD
ncbi:MAG: hypothetical protein ACREE2_12060 [Stellaceae bacterium]